MNQPLPTNPIPSVRGPKTFIIGDTGTGKTFSLRSAVDAGIEVFAIFTEPGFESVLGDTDPNKLHWHYLPPTPPTWDVLSTQFDLINRMTYEMLTKLPGDKSQFRQLLDLVTLMKNYKCQRTGKEFGDVAKFGNDKMVALDTLSGLSLMSQNSVIGTKPVMNPGEYKLAMDNVERFLNACCMNLTCGFTLMAHPERETDEVTGTVSIMSSTLGKKLAPKLPRFFDDVLYSIKRVVSANGKDEAKFYWQTVALNVVTKNRNLSLGSELPASFINLYQAWRSKTGAQSAPAQSAT